MPKHGFFEGYNYRNVLQFSSFGFDDPGILHLQYIGFHAGPGPH